MAEVVNDRDRLLQVFRDQQKEKRSADAEFFRILSEKEKEIEEAAQKLKEGYLEKEKKLLSEAKEREEIFSAREKELHRRSVDIERRAANYEMAINNLRSRSEAERTSYEEKYEAALSDLSREREQYKADIQSRIEGKSSEYVNDAIEALKSNEKVFYWTSSAWSVLGGLGIVLGLGFLLNSLHEGAKEVIENKDIGWMLICFLATKSMVVLGVVFALAKYALMFSKSYMHESLRNIERQHAINFGKFYLGTYGAGASWDSVKSVFEHWNISRDAAFLSPDQDQPQNTKVPPDAPGHISKTVEVAMDLGKKVIGKDA